MPVLYTLVLSLQILVLIICMHAIYVSLNMSVNQGQKYMTTFLLAVTIQNIGYFLELTQTTPEAALVAVRMQYTGSCFSLLFFALFVYYHYKAKIPHLLFRVLSFLDFVILIVMWSCNHHNFFYAKMDFIANVSHPHYEFEHGIGYSLFVIICCLIPWLMSNGIVLYQVKHNPYAVVGKNWKLFIVATFIPLSYLFFVSFVKTEFDLSPMILGFLLSVTVIFILSKNAYDLNELTLQTMLEELAEGIIIINPNGQIIQCNTSAEKIFRISKNSMLPETFLPYFNDAKARELDEVKINIEDRRYDCHARDIKDSQGAILGYFVLIIDVTDTENYIEQLKILKEKADAANISKSQFLSNMSHEIRTPMNSIIGITEIMLREKWNSKDKEYLMNIKNSGNALISIINDILDFSKIEAGNMEFFERNYEPSSMLNDLALMFLNRIGTKDVELLFDIDKNLPAVLYGDEVRVRQVIINLVNNAIKFTDTGYVKFKLRCEFTEKDVILKCSVEDTGSGIREEQMEKLFQAFKRLGLEEHYNKEGTGLGLSISKALIEHMNGSISVESEFMKGSIFSFEIHQGYVTDRRALSITDETANQVVIAALFHKECLYDSLNDILNQFNMRAIRYNKNDAANMLIDYLLVDLINYMEIESDIRSISSAGTKVVLLYNPMVDQFNNISGIEIVNKPLYTLSISSLSKHKKKAENQAREAAVVNFEAPLAKILLVDDNEMNRKVAKELLRPLKIQISEAVNGEMAIEMLKTQEYSLVLMDHMMPVMDGVLATKEIRAKNNPYYINLPIIALTANAIVGVKDEFIQAGMNDYISKPINVDELYEKIYNYLPKLLIVEGKNNVEEDTRVDLSVDNQLNEYLNIEEAINNCGSKSFFYELLADFYKLIELKSRKIESLLNEKMVRDYTIEVHALKNSARMIGALDLSEEFYNLEKLGNANDIVELKKITPQIIEHYRSYKKLLKPYADKANKAKTVIPMSELKKLLDKLYNEVDSFDYDHADETLNELEGLQLPDNIIDQMELLQAYMADVDMENILSTITEMQKRME